MSNDSEEKQAQDALLRFGRSMVRASILFEGTIVSVDETNYSCVVAVTGNNGEVTNYTNVPLKVVLGYAASYIEIPSVGSDCLLQFRDNNIQRTQLFQVDQCDKIAIQIAGASTLIVDANTWTFNGGNNGGLINIADIVTKLNNLENGLNTFYSTIFNTHTHGVVSLGSQTGVPVPTETHTFTPTVRSDIEDTTIKH